MKAIYEDLCKVLGDLEVIHESVDALRKRAEVIAPPVRVDDYYKILLAFKGLTDTIEILGVLKARAETANFRT